jgi:hypothetical protein
MFTASFQLYVTLIFGIPYVRIVVASIDLRINRERQVKASELSTAFRSI